MHKRAERSLSALCEWLIPIGERNSISMCLVAILANTPGYERISLRWACSQTRISNSCSLCRCVMGRWFRGSRWWCSRDLRRSRSFKFHRLRGLICFYRANNDSTCRKRTWELEKGLPVTSTHCDDSCHKRASSLFLNNFFYNLEHHNPIQYTTTSPTTFPIKSLTNSKRVNHSTFDFNLYQYEVSLALHHLGPSSCHHTLFRGSSSSSFTWSYRRRVARDHHQMCVIVLVQLTHCFKLADIVHHSWS